LLIDNYRGIFGAIGNAMRGMVLACCNIVMCSCVLLFDRFRAVSVVNGRKEMTLSSKRATLTLLCGVPIVFAALALARAAPFDDAIAAYKRGDYESALQLFRPLAEQGDAKAQGNLGRMYDYGRGVKKDQVQAIHWYRMAADQGLADAQTSLGYLYLLGDGTDKNYTQAMMWFAMAAQHGNADAQDALGDMYFRGEGVDQDDREALKWYRKAADQGLASAQSSLASIYEYSESVPRDLKEAARLYQLAADQDDADAEFALAKLYRDGSGVPQIAMLAYKLFSRAAMNSDTSKKDDAVEELYSLVAKLPAGTKLDPPLPPEPFGRMIGRWMIWPFRVFIAWIIVAMIWGVGSALFEMAAKKDSTGG
jgi:TPR repeat protein